MNSTSNNGWKRAIAWGSHFQACNEHLDCYDALNATRQGQVLDYSCKKVTDYVYSSVCLCGTRQLKIGENCDELTTFSYIGLALKLATLCFVLFVFAKGLRATWLCRGTWNPAFIALVMATIQTFSMLFWIIGMIMRTFATTVPMYVFFNNLGKSSSVPVACLTLMMEHGVIMIAWERSMANFNKRTKSMKEALLWFERVVKLYLVLMPALVLYFNVKQQYAKTSLATAASLLLFTIGFVFVGVKIHGLLSVSSSSEMGASGGLSRNPSMSAMHAAVRAIRVYTMWIALGNFLAVLSMVFFSVADGMGVGSRADNMFHFDVIAEQCIPIAAGNCSRNIVTYILASKKCRNNSGRTSSKFLQQQSMKQNVKLATVAPTGTR